MVVDNNWKAHSKTVRDAWAKSGIAVWPGEGIVGDRALGFLISLIKMKVNLVDFSLIRLIAWCKIKVLIIRGKILLVDFMHFSETQAFATDYRWIYQRHKLHVGKPEPRKDSKCDRSSTENNASDNCSRWWPHQLYEQWFSILRGAVR